MDLVWRHRKVWMGSGIVSSDADWSAADELFIFFILMDSMMRMLLSRTENQVVN